MTDTDAAVRDATAELLLTLADDLTRIGQPLEAILEVMRR